MKRSTNSTISRRMLASTILVSLPLPSPASIGQSPASRIQSRHAFSLVLVSLSLLRLQSCLVPTFRRRSCDRSRISTTSPTIRKRAISSRTESERSSSSSKVIAATNSPSNPCLVFINNPPNGTYTDQLRMDDWKSRGRPMTEYDR